MKTRLAIIGSVGIPNRYGGFEMLAEILSEKLSDQYKINVYCSQYHYNDLSKSYKSIRRIFLPFKANGFQSIIYDIISIIHALFKSDILLILGVSGSVILPIIKPFHRKNIIVSLGGLEWKRNKWSFFSKMYLKLSYSLAINYASVIIADNIHIYNYVSNKYNKKSKIIEYGGDHSKKVFKSISLIEKYKFLLNDYAFALARIEKENNCEMILQVFSKYNISDLVFIGNWNNSRYSRKLFHKYHKYENIWLLDEIYDINIINLIRSNCKVYIHGHSVGGTNPSLVEAMYVELPIIAFDVNFNRETTHDAAFYFNNSFDLIRNLCLLLNNDSERKKCARALANYAHKKYHWDLVVSKYSRIISKSYQT